MPQKRRGRKSPWQVQLRDVSGKLVTRSFVCREDALEYELAFVRNRQRARSNLAPIVLPTTFKVFREYWAKARKEANYPISTTSGEDQKLTATWGPLLDEKLVSEIGRNDIEPKLRDLIMKDGLAPATRNRHRALLSTIFEAAITEGRATLNPVAKIPVLKETKTRSMGHWGDPVYVERFISAAYGLGNTWGALMTLLLWTGVRVSEAIALQVGDLDRQRKVIFVRRIREVKTGKFRERTKGGGDGAVERVPMWPRVEKALTELLIERENVEASEWVFLHEGEPVTYWRAETRREKLIEQLGLPRVTLHGMRHTCSTLFQQSGMSREDAQQLLRHKQLSTTEIYSHPDMEYLIEKAKAKGFAAECPPSARQPHPT